MKRWKSLYETVTIPLNVGDTFLYGKFKNKKGIVAGFKKNEKGDAIVVTDTGKEISILKIRLVKEMSLQKYKKITEAMSEKEQVKLWDKLYDTVNSLKMIDFDSMDNSALYSIKLPKKSVIEMLKYSASFKGSPYESEEIEKLNPKKFNDFFISEVNEYTEEVEKIFRSAKKSVRKVNFNYNDKKQQLEIEVIF